MAKNPPKSRIPEPLLCAMVEYCRDNVDNTIALVSRVLRVNAAPKASAVDIAIAAYDAARHPKGFSAPVIRSPHAPIAKAPRNYWVRIVSSVDTTTGSAYGIKGKFINPEDAEILPENTVIVAMTKHGKSRNLYLMRSKHGKPTNLPFPSASPDKPLVISASVVSKYSNPSPAQWAGIFDQLDKMKARTSS